MSIPRVVVAGVTSGVGKTTISVAIMASLRKKGFIVQPFKVGPDFIDPSYHNLVAGRSSRNLDVWMMGKKGLVESFARACEGADLAVIEGVMGLYDGLSGKDNFASTAHVATILKSPIILVVDSSKAARSVAAIVLGFLRFDQRLRIAGVILNNVASERHAEYLREAMSSKAGNNIRILGMIRRDPKAKMEERHLGLVPALELEKKRQKRITSNAREIAEQLDIDGIVDVIRMQPAPSDDNPKTAEPRKKAIAKIAVALDESFNFYYQDNIEALREAGAELEFFSPVNDKGLPEGIDGLVLGGGFPEVLADKLEKNGRMIKSIRRQVNEDMPAYGECGGLMYFSRSISGFGGSERRRRMLGVVDADTAMTGKITLNYTEADCRAHLFGRCLLRGHEFHYSELRDIARDSKFAYSLRRGKGIVDGRDGIVFSENGIAAYSHHHFSGNRLAAKLVDACAKYSRR